MPALDRELDHEVGEKRKDVFLCDIRGILKRKRTQI